MIENLSNFTDVLGDDEIGDSQQSQPISFPSSAEPLIQIRNNESNQRIRPAKGTGQYNEFRSVEEIDSKYRDVFSYPYFNLVQSRVIDDALYSDKSLVVCAPTGSGKTVVFVMAIVQLLMEMEEKGITEDFKIIYMAPVKALCTERLTEWYSKFTKLGLLCIEVTGDTDVDFSQLQAFKIIITTPEKWDMLTRRWKDHRGLVEMIKLFLIDEVHILNDETRGPVLEAVVSRMKTVQSAAQLAHRIEKLQKQYQSISAEGNVMPRTDSGPTIRFVAVSATVSNPEDVAAWLKTGDKPAVYYKFGDECRPVKLRRVVEGYPCPDGTSIFKFDIILNYKLWPIIQKYHDGKPTLIFCNTRKSVLLTAETLSREITITFSPEQKAKLTALASTIKNKKFQALVLAGVGCHHAGMLYEERTYIEYAFRNGDLPILVTTTTLAMGVNLPAHLVIIKNTLQYVNGAYQEYSISTVLQMVGRAGRPQFDTDATAVIMTRLRDKARYQALAGGSEPLQSYLHKRLAENLNSETALGTVCDVAQCVQWLRSTFLYVRAARDPKRYLGLTSTAPDHLILKKIEELCVRAMNGLASAGLISMDEASCIESTEAGRLMSVFYLDLVTMKLIMKIQGNEGLERLLWIICECHELAEMHLRTDERRTLNTLNRNNAAATIRFPMKGKISSRQMKLNCIIQAVLGCLPIPDPSLNQEAMKIMRIADRVCKCLVAYVTRPEPVTLQLQYFSAVLNTIILAKCIAAHLWENSPYVSKQLKGIGPTFSTLLATAGKVNFMLLEESHPRDLERIMNKGAPAGNVLRKQISLLPKYHLEATPVDERTVSIKLSLINQAHLSENMDTLTAGPTHKCYVIAGDSENHLLLLTSFVDRDLIRVYDGTMSYEIKRKHSFEHKITVHCVSSSFVGIDTQCEYTFTDMMPSGPYNVSIDTSSHFFEGKTKTIPSKPTNVVMPKERKRKSNSDEVSQSKEKKKRDNALAEKFRLLKESFGRTSTVLKKDLQTTKEMTRNVLSDLGYPEQPATKLTKDMSNNNTILTDENLGESNEEINFSENDDDIMDDAKIDSILSEIETEITKVNNEPKTRVIDYGKKKIWPSENGPNLLNKSSSSVKHNQPRKRPTRFGNTKNNFEFLDFVEKSKDCDEDVQDMPVRETGFSEAIKLQVQNFIQKSYEAPPSIDLTLWDVHEHPKSMGNSHNINEEYNNANEISFHENNLLVNTIKEKDNENEEIQNSNSNETHKHISALNNNEDSYCFAEEELPKVNIKGPFSNLVTTNNFDPQKDTDKSLENEENNYSVNVFAKSINTSLIDSRNEQIDKNDSELIIPNEMGTTINYISYNPKVKGSNDIKEVTVLSNEDDIMSKDSKNNSNPCDLQSFTSKKPACVSVVSQIQKEISANDLILWRQQQNKIEPQPIDKSIAKVSNDSGQFKTFGGSQLSSVTDIVHSNQDVPDESLYHRENLEAHENTGANYTNNYNFTAEKVDVHTKYTNDHKIRIIRRLKVDLDVREIVSRCVNSSDGNFNKQELNNIYMSDTYNSQAKNSNNYHTCKNITVEPKCILSKELPTITSIAEVNENKDKVLTIRNGQFHVSPKICTTEVDDQSKVTRMLGSMQESQDDNEIAQREDKKPHAKLTRKEGSIGMLEIVQQENNEKSKSSNTENIKTQSDEPHTEDLQQNIDVTAQQENKKPDEDVARKKNSIGNILQKYAQIIRNNKNSDIRNTPNLTRRETININPAPFKSTRPFKITEIQNLNVPLPSFCENIQPSPARVAQAEIVKSVITNRIQTPPAIMPVVKNLSEKPLDHKDLSPCQSPVQLLEQSLDISEDELSLDQSMFDPKTLLQNMGRDDIVDLEIIPPPPEFCNDDFNSPEIYNNEDLKSQIYTEDINQTCSGIHNTSVLEDVFPETSNLTPSKEIETWTLDRDNEFNNSFKYTTPTQSYTVMRRKLFQSYNTPPQGSQDGTSRQGRLSQFKFHSKNKFKL